MGIGLGPMGWGCLLPMGGAWRNRFGSLGGLRRRGGIEEGGPPTHTQAPPDRSPLPFPPTRPGQSTCSTVSGAALRAAAPREGGRGGSPTPGASTIAPTWAGHTAGSQVHALEAAWCSQHNLGPGSHSTRHLRTDMGHPGLSTDPAPSKGGSHVLGQRVPGRPWSPLPRLHLPSQTTPLARGRASHGEEGASREVRIRNKQVQSQRAYCQPHREEGECQGWPAWCGGEQQATQAAGKGGVFIRRVGYRRG